MVMHKVETHYQMEHIDYEKQRPETNTRQAAAEFAAITSSVLHKSVPTCNSLQGNESMCPNQPFAHYSGRAVKETGGDSSQSIPTNLEISVQNNNYVKPNLESPNEKLVNAIRSVLLDGSNCEEPCSFPSFNNRWYPRKIDLSSQVSEEENGMMEDGQWYGEHNGGGEEGMESYNGGGEEGMESYVCEVQNKYTCYDGDEMREYVLDGINVQNASTYYIPESNIPIRETDPNLTYQNSIGCDNCKVMKEEFDEWKKRMLENFQILKLKVMSTDELISEHHKDCADLESEKKLVKDFRSKLDVCYGQTGALRIQLEKAIQANEPLKKTVQRFEYEKSVKQQTIDELKMIMKKNEEEIMELKTLTNSSRCVQEDYKRAIDGKGKEDEKNKKKLLHQAKLIDKLTKSLTTVKQRQKNESKLLKKALRENERFKSESQDIKLMKLSLTHQAKMLKRNVNMDIISPGKASKKSPIGVLSPSPSPPPANVSARAKHVNKAGKREHPKVEHFICNRELVGENLSSSSQGETDDEMEELLGKSHGRMSLSQLFNIPTILSPALSPIPPSPIPTYLSQHTNTTTSSQIMDSLKVNTSLLQDSINTNDGSSLFGDISQSDEEDDKGQIHKICAEKEMSIEERDSPAAEKIAVNHQTTSQIFHSSSDIVQEVMQGSSDNQRNNCKQEDKFVSRSNIHSSPTYSKDENHHNYSGSQPPPLRALERSFTNQAQSNSSLQLVSENEDIFGGMSSKQNNDKFNLVASDVQTSDTMPVNLPSVTTSNTVMKKEKLSACKTMPVNLPTATTSSMVLNKEERLNSAVLQSAQKLSKVKNNSCEVNNDNNVLYKSIVQKKSRVSERKRKKGVNLCASSVSRNTRNAKFRRKWNPRYSPDEEKQKDIGNIALCLTASDIASEGSMDTHKKSSDGTLEEDIQSNVETVDMSDGVILKADTVEITKSFESHITDNLANLPLTNDDEDGTNEKMELNEEENVDTKTCVETSVPLPFSTSVDNIKESISHVGIGINTPIAMTIVSDLIEQNVFNELKRCSSPVKKSLSDKNYVSVSPQTIDNPKQTPSVKDKIEKEIEETGNSTLSGHLHAVSATGNIDCSKSASEEVDSEVILFKLPVQHQILPNTDSLTSMVPDKDLFGYMGNESRSNHSDIKKSPSQRVSEHLPITTKTTEQYISHNICTFENDSKVTYNDRNLHADGKCNVDETVANVTDDLDSEVASFKLPAQRVILIDPDDSPIKSDHQLSVPTTQICENDVVARSITNTQISYSSTHNTSRHTVYNSPSASRYTLPNSCQCSNLSTTSSVFWSVSSRRRQAVNRRHSMYAYGVDTVPSSFLASRLRVERTRSLSPTLFSPPSPPLSPIPPSPRRSMLTPIISPLPTTPLPESVSPLPPSPKITSPPLIRSSALLRTDDPSIFVPKPLTHDTSSAVKVLKFTKNDYPRNYQSNRKKDDASNVRRSILEARARSCSPCFPKKSSNNAKVCAVNSNIIATSMSTSVSSSESRSFETPVSVSSEVQSPGSRVTSTSCAITKVCCYPYTTEEQSVKTNMCFPSPCSHGEEADSTSSALNLTNPIATDSQVSCMKNVVTTNSSSAKQQSIPCGKSRRLKSTVNSIEKRIKSMKSSCNIRYLNSSMCVTKSLNNNSKNGSRLEVDLNSSLKQTFTPYSSSTITKPAKQADKTPGTSVCLTPFSIIANESKLKGDGKDNVTMVTTSFSPIKVSSKNVWMRVDEKTEILPITRKLETKNNAVNKVLPDLSSDDDALRIVCESNASQEESGDDISKCDKNDVKTIISSNQTMHLITTNLINRDEGNTSQTNLTNECSHIVTESCAHEIDNGCELDTKPASYTRTGTLPDNSAAADVADEDNSVCEATIGTQKFETTDLPSPTENEGSLEHVDLFSENAKCEKGINESSPSLDDDDDTVNVVEEKGERRKREKMGEKRKLVVKLNFERRPKKQDVKHVIKGSCASEVETDKNTKVINTTDEIDSKILSNEKEKLASDEEGEIFDSNDDIEDTIRNVMLGKQTFENKCEIKESVTNSIQNVQVDKLEQFIKSPSKQSLKMRKKQSELGYVKKCIHDFRHKVISRKDVIFLLCQTSNLSTMKTFSTAIILSVQKCEETLLHKILKSLENKNGCSCKLKQNKCIKCYNVECVCKGNNGHKCSNCKKLTSKCTSSDSKASLHMRESRDTFMKCHPYAECISPPVLTTFEKEMLTILVAVLKGVKFKTCVTILLDDLQLKIISSEDILVCERLALCRMFAAVCRIYKKRERLLGFVFCVGYDMLPSMSYSMIFITCYSIWPNFMRRSDLIMQDSNASKLILHKIKLSPLSAVLQFLALSESVERKESVSQKILESFMSVKYSYESTSFNYYEDFIEELFLLLEDTELSFVIRSQGNEIEMSPFVFSTMKAIEILCKRMGWQWTYNKVIVEKVWSTIKSYICAPTYGKCDTAAIFIRLSGYLCQYGLSVKSDLQDYCQLLTTTLNKILDSETVVDSLEIAIVHTLLNLVPTYATECYLVLASWLDQTERRNLIVSKSLSDAIYDIKGNL